MTLGARKTRLADSARAAIHPPTPSGRKSRQPTAAASCSLWARQGESSQPLFLATATTRTWPGSHCYDQDQDQDDDNETTLCFLLAPPATFCASVWKAISGRALFSLSLSLSLPLFLWRFFVDLSSSSPSCASLPLFFCRAIFLYIANRDRRPGFAGQFVVDVLHAFPRWLCSFICVSDYDFIHVAPLSYLPIPVTRAVLIPSPPFSELSSALWMSRDDYYVPLTWFTLTWTKLHDLLNELCALHLIMKWVE